MITLALEFSSDHRSAAVVRDDRVLAESTDTLGRSTPTFPLIEQALARAGVEREVIECVAIGLGPGSYTGVRLAISVAQGWQLATGVRIAAMSSFDAMALEACMEGGPPISFIADAQRNEFAIATAEAAAGGFRWRGPLRLVSHDETWERLRNGEAIAGPVEGLSARGGVERWPGAGAVGRLAERRGEFVAPTALAPIYLRETSFVKAPTPRSLGKLRP